MTDAIKQAFEFVIAQDVDIPADVWMQAVKAGALKAGEGDLSAINAAYHNAINAALTDYANGGSIVAARNAFKRAMIEAFGDAWDLGMGGGIADGAALEWFNARVQQELAFIDALFVQLRELRRDPDFDIAAWILERVDGYVRTVRDIYNQAKVWSLGNKMLTFDGKDGRPDNICQRNHGTCVRLKGKRHRARWWVSHGLVPYRGNSQYTCGAWECQHYLRDDDGNRITV